MANLSVSDATKCLRQCLSNRIWNTAGNDKGVTNSHVGGKHRNKNIFIIKNPCMKGYVDVEEAREVYKWREV